MRIPDAHLIEADPHRARRVAAEVLVGEEEDAAAAGEGPFEDGAGVARGADDPAVAATEGLEACRRIDVGDGGQLGGVDDGAEIGPGILHLMDRGHVGHRAAGGEIGEDDRHAPAAAGGDLVGAVGEDVGRLGHEVDAAEGNRLAFVPIGSRAGELVAVPLEVGVGDDAVLLVVVAEDHEPAAHSLPHPLDPGRELGVGEGAVVGEWAREGRGGGGAAHGVKYTPGVRRLPPSLYFPFDGRCGLRPPRGPPRTVRNQTGRMARSMARKVVNRKELRAQNDAAEARGKETTEKKEKVAKEPKAKKEKVAKEPKVAAKKTVRKKVAKETRLKAYWGVFNQAMKRLVLFEYADKKAAEKKASELTASSRATHFIQLVKEAITE